MDTLVGQGPTSLKRLLLFICLTLDRTSGLVLFSTLPVLPVQFNIGQHIYIYIYFNLKLKKSTLANQTKFTLFIKKN